MRGYSVLGMCHYDMPRIGEIRINAALAWKVNMDFWRQMAIAVWVRALFFG